MKKVYLPLISIMLIGTFAILIYGFFSFQKIKESIISNERDHLHLLYKIQLKAKKNLGLTDALLLANDAKIKKALKENNKMIAFEEIKNLNKIFKTYTPLKDIKIAIYTKNMDAFLEDWNLNKQNKNIFRKTLHWVQTHKKPLVTIEVGEEGIFLRAIAPVIDKGEYLGSVEFMQDFNAIAKELKKENIYLIVEYLKNNKHILALKEYNQQFYNEIKETKITPIIITQKFYAISIPIKDFENKIIAYSILGETNKALSVLIEQKRKELIITFIILGVITFIMMAFIVYVMNEFAIKPINEAKKKIEETNKFINESIRYASVIQRSILPKDFDYLKEYFQDSFLLWQPRDTVSGDIYFAEKISEDELIVMAIDCTGHGIPGAFITMLVKAVEKQIMFDIKKGVLSPSPSEILKYFNIQLSELSNNEEFKKVGFDGGVIYFNKKENILKYSGAKTPLFYIEDGKVKMLKGSKKSVGYGNSKEVTYKETLLNLKKNTNFYITTDGFIDQNGGPKDIPFGKKRFMNLLLKYYQLPFKDQKRALLDEFEKWLNSTQTDDITVIGMKI